MTDLFPRARGLSRGYALEPVAEFFAAARSAYEHGGSAFDIGFDEIRRIAFPMQRGGYDPVAVDRALARLESAFVERDRAAYINAYGESAWYSKVADQATALYPRLLRPAGGRFNHPEKGQVGYRVDEVDQVMDRLADFFNEKGTVTESYLRSALFRSAKGEGAYDEAQVDAFLGRAIHILLGVS